MMHEYRFCSGHDCAVRGNGYPHLSGRALGK